MDAAKPPSELVPSVWIALHLAADYARQSLSEATQRAYHADWSHFTAWCQAADLPPLPATPQFVAAYLASMAATHSRATIRRRLLGIGQAHRYTGHEWISGHPVIRATLRGIFRVHGKPASKSAAIGISDIRRLVATCGHGLTGLRDRAIILIGFAGALRRAELAAVEREHLTFVHEGVRLLIPRAKGDQEGEGAEIGIPKCDRKETCPTRALEAWLTASRCKYGPVFRKIDRWGTVEHRALHPGALATILKQRAKMAGLKTTGFERISAHGLRAGFITEAVKAGARDD